MSSLTVTERVQFIHIRVNHRPELVFFALGCLVGQALVRAEHGDDALLSLIERALDDAPASIEDAS